MLICKLKQSIHVPYGDARVLGCRDDGNKEAFGCGFRVREDEDVRVGDAYRQRRVQRRLHANCAVALEMPMRLGLHWNSYRIVRVLHCGVSSRGVPNRLSESDRIIGVGCRNYR